MLKISLFTLLLLNITLALAQESFCTPVPESKTYINPDFSRPYPREVSFECTYNCTRQGRVEKVKAVTTTMVRDTTEDARNTTCLGVKMKQVPWGWELDGYEAFYAFNASMVEMKRYAFENLKRNTKVENEQLLKLKETLTYVANNFLLTNVESFMNAAKEMQAIANELPSKTTKLDLVIKQIVALRGQIPPGASAATLLYMQINTHAHWRIPTYLYQ
jgi:hypothetical protein